MARFSNPIGSGEGGDLPQPLATTSSPTFNKITLTSNGATDNITIGDDVILGDGNVANHVVIIGQQDETAGGIVLGTNETEFISTNGTDLSLTADNDIVLYPGSNYAYLNVIDEDHRLATMADIASGTQGEPGADGADGADALWSFLGEWQNGIDYAAGSVVEFQGSSYYHPDGQFSSYSPPTNGWLLVSSKGDTGENGADGADGAPGADGNDGSPGLVYLGNYVSGNGYVANLAVVKGSDNNLYIATSSGGLGDPVGNSAEWSIFLPKGSDGSDGADGEDAETVSETSFTVNGGSLGTMPTFNGAPLFSGSYVKTGPLVHFQIQVDMDNITNFGTGQYYVDLPFPAKYGYQVREGCLHDISTDRQYAIGGHVFAGQSRLNLFFTDTNGQDQEFDHNSPVTLAIADNFHIAGTYISE
jgi:hypothetical protein